MCIRDSIYTDEGISATNTKRREGFKAMVADALAGKIDLIVTKSVSRFARNTVDSLTTVRTLKEKGVEIYFEKENIWTLDANCLLYTSPASSGTLAGLDLHDGKHALAGKLPGLGIVRPRPFADVQIGDADLDGKRHIRCRLH